MDYDGRDVSLTFDFGDGSEKETALNTEGIVKHTYTDPGAYLVTVTATSFDNRFKIINPGNIIVGPSKGLVGTITILEGDKNGTQEKVKVKLSSIGSYDPNDTNGKLKYNWSWSARTFDTDGNIVDISDVIAREQEGRSNPDRDADEIASASPRNDSETFEYTFTQPGQYIPVLEIENSLGIKSKFFGETFTITSDQAPVASAKIIGDKLDGEPW